MLIFSANICFHSANKHMQSQHRCDRVYLYINICIWYRINSSRFNFYRHWTSTAKNHTDVLAVVIFKEIRRARILVHSSLAFLLFFESPTASRYCLYLGMGWWQGRFQKWPHVVCRSGFHPPARMLPCPAPGKELVLSVASVSWTAFSGVMTQMRTLPPGWNEEHFLGYSNTADSPGLRSALC